MNLGSDPKNLDEQGRLSFGYLFFGEAKKSASPAGARPGFYVKGRAPKQRKHGPRINSRMTRKSRSYFALLRPNPSFDSVPSTSLAMLARCLTTSSMAIKKIASKMLRSIYQAPRLPSR